MAAPPNGAVVVGGGFNQHGDVGCENPDLRALTELPQGGACLCQLRQCRRRATSFNRPKGCLYELRLKQDATLCPTRASHLAPQALTHSYGESQRYVRMNIRKLAPAALSLIFLPWGCLPWRVPHFSRFGQGRRFISLRGIVSAASGGKGNRATQR